MRFSLKKKSWKLNDLFVSYKVHLLLPLLNSPPPSLHLFLSFFLSSSPLSFFLFLYLHLFLYLYLFPHFLFHYFLQSSPLSSPPLFLSPLFLSFHLIYPLLSSNPNHPSILSLPIPSSYVSIQTQSNSFLKMFLSLLLCFRCSFMASVGCDSSIGQHVGIIAQSWKERYCLQKPITLLYLQPFLPSFSYFLLFPTIFFFPLSTRTPYYDCAYDYSIVVCIVKFCVVLCYFVFFCIVLCYISCSLFYIFLNP